MIDPIPVEVVEPPKKPWPQWIVQVREPYMVYHYGKESRESAEQHQKSSGFPTRILRILSEFEVELARLREAMHEAAIDVLERRADGARFTYEAARDAYFRATGTSIKETP